MWETLWEKGERSSQILKVFIDIVEVNCKHLEILGCKGLDTGILKLSQLGVVNVGKVYRLM